jgi:small-conductance mechanosensitive channel
VVQVEAIAGIFIHQLMEARHRGAFEMAYTGFSKLCRSLWSSPESELGQKPHVWVRELLDSLQSSSVAKLLTVTRRSAGLPFFMQVRQCLPFTISFVAVPTPYLLAQCIGLTFSLITFSNLMLHLLIAIASSCLSYPLPSHLLLPSLVATLTSTSLVATLYLLTCCTRTLYLLTCCSICPLPSRLVQLLFCALSCLLDFI